MIQAVENPEVNVTLYSAKSWHERLGHINNKQLFDVEKKVVNGLTINNHELFDCESCHLAKFHRQPFQKLEERQFMTKPGEMFHTGLCKVWYKKAKVSKIGFTPIFSQKKFWLV